MTTLKLMAAALGISLAAITAVPQNAVAERVDRDQRIYQSNPYYGGTPRTQQYRQDRRNHRATVYAVPYDRFQRYVNRYGRHDLGSRRFRKWAVRNGRPVRHPATYYNNNQPRDYRQNRWQNGNQNGWQYGQQNWWQNGQQNGWWNNRYDGRRKPWQPQWVYVDLRSGRYWF
ncbi:MAG: hypothetical protein GY791_11135 [Alphaproteobacteria bacterium]|nr:hypothetical protein [Alphaproteobacteria bacterium]